LRKKIESSNILRNFVTDGDEEWTHGNIYDSESSKTYSCNMQLVDGPFEIRGYVLMPLFGMTEIWEKVE